MHYDYSLFVTSQHRYVHYASILAWYVNTELQRNFPETEVVRSTLSQHKLDGAIPCLCSYYTSYAVLLFGFIIH